MRGLRCFSGAEFDPRVRRNCRMGVLVGREVEGSHGLQVWGKVPRSIQSEGLTSFRYNY